MKTMHTDEFLNQEVWDKLVSQCGNNNEVLKDHPLIRHTGKTHSQWGEDGVFDRILSKIGMTNKVAIEFGAKNGIRISTTLLLRRKYDFRRILIEANASDYCKSEGESIIYDFITPENINDLLKQGDCPEHPDVLSIDIDGDDYWVWKAIEPKARVVCVEYQSAIPNDVPLAILPGQTDVKSHLKTGWNLHEHPVEHHDPNLPVLNGYFSANLLAIYDLAKEKGYKFCVTLMDNAFFVLDEEFDKLGIPEVSREDCAKNYFQPEIYWWKNRDRQNREWMVV